MPVTRIVVKRDGSIEVEGIGYTGKACIDALQQLLAMLKQYGVDVKVDEQKLKPEYYQEVSTKKPVEDEW